MTKLKRWFQNIGSLWAYWRYLRLKDRRNSAVTGMTREQAVARGLISQVKDDKHFDRMDAWPTETAEVVISAADKEKIASLKEAAAKAETALGTGRDVNSLAWQELINRFNET